MRENNFAYIEGENEGFDIPLQNFLPPLQRGIFTSWIKENQFEQNYLIDPISANPVLPIMLAQNGIKVLAARNNPINWLITEVLCVKNSHINIRNSVNKLLVSRKDGRSLEDILKPMYLTPCKGCGKYVQAEGFIWNKGQSIPTSRVYSCPYCGDGGEREITTYDVENLRQLGKLEIYLSRAIQHVSPEKGYEEETIKSAISCYPPRALYACMLLINRFSILDIDKEQRKFLRAALLTVFNDAHSLRHWPLQNYRFLQFSIPQRFFEKNLFLSLTNADKQWPEINRSTPFSYWPNLPPENGGVCFFQTRLAESNNLFNKIEHATVVTVFPRPGQTYWTLSALWAGWLWGKKAVRPMRSALRRRRYGWFWYAKAIYHSVNRLNFHSKRNIRFFGLFPFYTPNLSYGLFAGMQCAGYSLYGAAFRQDETLLQAVWEYDGDRSMNIDNKNNYEAIINNYLGYLNEPVEFQDILMMVIIQSSLNSQIAGKITDLEENAFSGLNHQIKKLTEKPGFLLMSAPETQSIKRYLLYQRNTFSPSYSEKIERYILQILMHANEISYRSIDRLTCAHFKGHATPKKELIDHIICSYAEELSDRHEMFRLLEKETKIERDKDLNEIIDLIKTIGAKLDYGIIQNKNIAWIENATKKAHYVFYVTTRANFSQIILDASTHEDAQHILVYPGSRAALVYYRLQQDFRLVEALENDWHLVKFRHIKRMAEKEFLSCEIWKDLLDNDPPVKAAPTQLQIL